MLLSYVWGVQQKCAGNRADWGLVRYTFPRHVDCRTPGRQESAAPTLLRADHRSKRDQGAVVCFVGNKPGEARACSWTWASSAPGGVAKQWLAAGCPAPLASASTLIGCWRWCPPPRPTPAT